MTNLKTQKNDDSVQAFLQSVADENQRADAFALLELMKEVTGEEPAMWGSSIIGFGTYHYVYASGREGDWMKVGFSPRKGKTSLYLMCDIQAQEELLTQLGKYKTGKSCLYIKRLSDVNVEILRKLIENTVAEIVKKYGT